MLNYAISLAPPKSRSGGFTLIELMIVIAVLAIIVTLAIPAYQDYSIRTKVSECILGAAPAKLSIAEYRSTIEEWPPDAEMASLNNNGLSEFCNGFVAYDPGTGSFQVNVNELALDPEGGISRLQPQLTPQMTSLHVVTWRCSLGTTAVKLAKYLPSSCRDF